MPVKRRLGYRRHRGYGRWDRHQLLTGFDFFNIAWGRDTPPWHRLDVQGMRRGWDDLRDELLPTWIVDRPGTRPHAWWLFDAPEPRRRIDGLPHPWDNPERWVRVKGLPFRTVLATYKLSFGKPSSWLSTDDRDAEYETEIDYLDRLDLFVGRERQRLIDLGELPACSESPNERTHV